MFPFFKHPYGASSNNFTGENVVLDVVSDVFPVIPLLSFPKSPSPIFS